MLEFLSTLERIGSILAGLGVFILWVFSRNFVGKEEFIKELKSLTQELKIEYKQGYKELKMENKATYEDLNKQKVTVAELNTKMDNLIKSVDSLNNGVNFIKECFIDRKK